MEIVGLFAILGIIVLCVSSVGGGSRDRRFKTGRKGNVLPTYVPFRVRLVIASVLWAAGFATAFPKEAAYFIAVGVLVPVTWIAFPFFVSPFTKYRNSAAQLLAGRVIACILFGIYVPYLVVTPFQPNYVANSNSPAQNVRQQSPELPRIVSVSSSAPATVSVMKDTTSSIAPTEGNQSTPAAAELQSSQPAASSPSPASPGPSFDCQRAASQVEKTICSSPVLARLDSELAVAFASALQRTQDPTLARQAQRDWLRNQRNSCDSPSCLENVYTSRIASLNAQ